MLLLLLRMLDIRSLSFDCFANLELAIIRAVLMTG